MNGLLCQCMHCKPINLHVLILSERSINNLKDKIPKGRSDVMLYFETTKKKLNDRIYVDYKKKNLNFIVLALIFSCADFLF